MAKWQVTCKCVKKNSRGTIDVSIPGNWLGDAVSESEALSKARKHFEGSRIWELQHGYILEDIVARPK